MGVTTPHTSTIPSRKSLWKPRMGAVVRNGTVRFGVWATEVNRMEVVVERSRGAKIFPLMQIKEDLWAGEYEEVQTGDLYRYRLNGDRLLPDPASRYQPLGVHGPSQVIDPHRFEWKDQDWNAPAQAKWVVYELHTGAFTPRGTFAAIQERLPYLQDLGVTAIELMPVGDFPGDRNWGYDGVALFAPARCYGTPDELRALIDAAHSFGIAVLLDAVYNHFGPDGAYLHSFSRHYLSHRHMTPWGDAVNLDGEKSNAVRSFFIENALHWLSEYHFDGLRLDATHALIDTRPMHFLAELSGAVQSFNPERRIVLIAEDHRNLAKMIQPREAQGYGLDAVWSDDFHHQLRRKLAGDREGYFQDFSGDGRDIATTIQTGWFYTGQFAKYFRATRGSLTDQIDRDRFIFCLQNHDQIGNRPFGDRLHHKISAPAYRAATTLLLTAPESPLLFMGQEWAASSPFCYFTDHNPELGKLVTEGRRNEFAAFTEFRDPARRETIPDPQFKATFEKSKLNWDELEQPQHANVFNLYQALIALRKEEPAFLQSRPDSFEVEAIDPATIVLKRKSESDLIVVIAKLEGSGEYTLSCSGEKWQPILDTEGPAFASDPIPIRIRFARGELRVQFGRPGAIILRNRK